MKFNGVDPRTIHAGVSVAKEIPPGAPTSQLETLMGSSGEIIAGRTIQQGEYIARINIAGKNRAEAWQIRKLLAGWARAADIVTHELIPTHWPAVAYDAVLKEITPPEFSFGHATVDVVFTLPRPIAHDVSYQSVTGGSSVTASIGGTAHARPSIALNMASSGSLTLKVDGTTYFAMIGGFSAGSVVTIRPDISTVLVNGAAAERYVDYVNTDFERLCKACTPGSHTFSCSQASSVQVSWRNEWL